MEAVWKSYLETNKSPPQNAFKLVNYSRNNSELRTLTYNEAKRLIDKNTIPLKTSSIDHKHNHRRRSSNKFKPKKYTKSITKNNKLNTSQTLRGYSLNTTHKKTGQRRQYTSSNKIGAVSSSDNTSSDDHTDDEDFDINENTVSSIPSFRNKTRSYSNPKKPNFGTFKIQNTTKTLQKIKTKKSKSRYKNDNENKRNRRNHSNLQMSFFDEFRTNLCIKIRKSGCYKIMAIINGTNKI